MITRCEITRREKFEIEKGIHHFNSLIITLDGEFEYTVGNVTKTVLPYNPVIFGKGIRFIKRVITPIEFIFISSPQFQYEGKIFLCYDERDKVRLKSSITHLKDAIINGLSDNVKEHFVNDILLTSKLCVAKTSYNDPRSAYEYICQKYNQKISLDFLAGMENCSKQTLINKFKKSYGKTPIKCITELRINKAKELLTNTRFSVFEISEKCGYDNVYYFSNVFKKETGFSPIKFRQSYVL
jgi:AraC-like DNA-binding protein